MTKFVTFIVLYIIVGGVMSVLSLSYMYFYFKHKGLLGNKTDRIFDDVLSHIASPVHMFEETNVFYTKILVVMYVALMPIIIHTCVFRTIKEADRLCDEKHSS